MCGIAGIFSHSKQPAEFWYEWGKSFSKSIAHRGPDDEGFLLIPDEGLPLPAKTASRYYRETAPYIPKVDLISVQEESILGLLLHRRLSILGLSELGHQPMCDEDGRFWISFNGEIYNYKELGETYNFSQKTQTDTEIILQLWKLKGEECLSELDGFFAICIYDARKKEVFLARDRTGVKPIYYGVNDGVFAFSSTEIALSYLFNSTSISDQAVFHHIRFGMTDVHNWFEHVQSVKPGELLIWNLENQQIEWRQWFIPHKNHSKSVDILELLQVSMQRRLRSDVPIGFAVSGGIDSAIIAGLSRKIMGKEAQLKSFSITSKGFDSDESSWQTIVNEYNGLESHAVDIGQFSWELLPEMIYSSGRPAVAWNNLAHFALCKEVKKQGVTVLFNGQGADEIFGGYPDYFIEDFSLFKKYLWTMRHHLPIPFFMLGPIQTKRKLSYSQSPEKRWLSEKKKWGSVLTEKLFEINRTELNPSVTSVQERMLGDYYGSMMNHKFYGRLQQMLAWDDRNGMAFQLESRNPFSDDHDLASAILGKFTLRELSEGGYPKGMLRKAVKGIVPQILLERTDKKGFSVPDAILTQKHGERWKDACMSSELDQWIHRDFRSKLMGNLNKLTPKELSVYFKICSLGYFVQGIKG